MNVLTTHSAWLFSSLVLGCNGLLSGSGSVIADLQAELFQAVQRNDLAAAQALNDRIYPTARVFYAEPWADMHNRMKEALVLLGRLPRAVVRPPLVKLCARRDRSHPRCAGRGGAARREGRPRRGVTRRRYHFRRSGPNKKIAHAAGWPWLRARGRGATGGVGGTLPLLKSSPRVRTERC